MPHEVRYSSHLAMTSARTVTEIIDVLQFARDLHKDCKNAGDDYAEISTEVRDLHTVLRHLRDEAREPQSVLNRDAAVYAKDLAPILKDCDSTLHSLDDLQRRYDGIRLRTGEADMLAEIRLRLINQRTRITRLLDAVQLRGKKAVPNNIDEIEHSRVLDIILDKVDVIAARMGGKTGSLMTTYENDDREVWKDFRRELIDEGFSREVVSKNEVCLIVFILSLRGCSF
jgi:septal ring factor EnvC (AmiA/AmiB activator)